MGIWYHDYHSSHYSGIAIIRPDWWVPYTLKLYIRAILFIPFRCNSRTIWNRSLSLQLGCLCCCFIKFACSKHPCLCIVFLRGGQVVLTSVLNLCLTCRNVDVATRQKYVNLVESVKEYGGTVHIFSSMHVSGDRECTTMLLWYALIIVLKVHNLTFVCTELAQLTGIAAILRFPLPELEDAEMDWTNPHFFATC
jgi:hypothetical protein